MTRIVAGDAKGRRLVVPKGEGTRPTSERVREAIFGALDARGRLAGANVLDLYAGSGAMGLEAASRGAASVVLVDSARQAVDAARQNVSALALPRVTVVLSSVQRFLSRSESSTRVPHRTAAKERPAASLVFADPPYELGQLELAAVLEGLTSGGWLEPGALIVVERSSRAIEPQWPEGMFRRAIRRYGDTAVWEAEWLPPGSR